MPNPTTTEAPQTTNPAFTITRKFHGSNIQFMLYVMLFNSEPAFTVLNFPFQIAPRQTTCKDTLPDEWKNDAEFVDGINCGALTCAGLAHMPGLDYCSKDFSSGYLSHCANGTKGQLQDFCRWSCRNCGAYLNNTIHSFKAVSIIQKQ